MVAQFGNEYVAYAARTGRFVPRPPNRFPTTWRRRV
jgi:hypothetical protein